MNNFYLNYVMNILKLKNYYQVHVYFVGKKYSFEQITNIRKNLPLLKKSVTFQLCPTNIPIIYYTKNNKIYFI